MPDPGLVVAIDIGTTGVKAAAVDAAAVSHAAAAREYPTLSPRPGWAVQDPDVVVGMSAAAVAEVMARVRAAGRRVAGVAFSAAMHSLIALGADGRPLTPSVTWADGRASAQARRLRDGGEWLALHRRTGTPVHPMSPLVKLLWFREEAPDVWQRAAHWVGIKEYVLFRLTGLLAVDESIASATGLYGLAARDWDPGALDLAGLRRDQLPSLLATTGVMAPSLPGWPPAPSGPAPPSAGWSRRLGSTSRVGSSATCWCRTGGWSAGRPTTAATCSAGWAAWPAPTWPIRTAGCPSSPPACHPERRSC